MNRIVVLAVSVVLVLVVAAPTAFARTQSPPYPIDETPLILPAKGDPDAYEYLSCEFPVSLVRSGIEKDVQLPSVTGSFTIIQAGHESTLTNLDTGKQVTLKDTGTLVMGAVKGEPSLIRETLTGTNLVGSEETGFALITGHFTQIETGNEDGTGWIIIQPLSGEGQITDVCALLS